MALELSFDVCKGAACTSLLFTETTGAYDALLNTTGWGTPNLDLGSVTETHILITLPDGTEVDILNPVGLPTDDDEVSYEILSTALDAGWSVVQDGQYTFEYTVTDGITEYTTGPQFFLFTCNIECCVRRMFAQIATNNDCSCDSTLIKNALFASALLYGLKANGDCGNTTIINSLISKLNQICGFTEGNCGCH